MFAPSEDFRDAFCVTGGAFGRPCLADFIFEGHQLSNEMFAKSKNVTVTST